MKLLYMKAYLINFAAAFIICLGISVSIVLSIHLLIPFLVWDISLIYNEVLVSSSFFIFRVLLLISLIVSVSFCFDSER